MQPATCRSRHGTSSTQATSGRPPDRMLAACQQCSLIGAAPSSRRWLAGGAAAPPPAASAFSRRQHCAPPLLTLSMPAGSGLLEQGRHYTLHQQSAPTLRHPQSRLCGRKICASPAAAHCVSTVALPGTRPECQPRFASSSPRLPFGLARLSATSSLVGQPQTSACSSSWVLRRVRRRSGCLWSAATATRLLSRARAPSRALTLHHLTRPDLKASICHTALKRCPTALLQSAAPACRCTARCSAHSLACCGSSSRFIQTAAAT